MRAFLLVVLLVIVNNSLSDPSSDLNAQIDTFLNTRSWRGIQLEITKNGKQIFYHDKGIKNQRNQSVDANTLFRIASVSKSFSSVAILQLVEQGKLQLNDTLTKIFGFQVKNPHFPDVPITVQMILSHQSSIVQPDTQYDQFLTDTYNSKDGSSVPSVRQILLPGGKYYNPSIFPATRKPGEYFHYSNLGFLLAGTIVEIVSQKRFDIHQKENILDVLSEGLQQNCTYNIGTIKDYRNLGVIFKGEQGKWIASLDSYNGTIPSRNLTLYKLGTNGGVFGPQGGLRASVRHLNNYMYMYANKGLLKSGKRLLSQKSVQEILKPRYQYHGVISGPKIDMHLYGFGIFTTTFSASDIIIQHEVVRGHTGSAYGLISATHFWKDYTFSYIINGALNGYKYDSNYIYQVDAILLHQSIDTFIQKTQTASVNTETNLKFE